MGRRESRADRSWISADSVAKYVDMFGEMEASEDPLGYLENKLTGVLAADVIGNLRTIRQSVETTKAADFELVFDPTLVRGMSYYTGTIFEIEMPEFGSSVAGGGRYDKMIGKFTGNDTPACGFSIGFERIVTILLENNFQVPGAAGKKAFLIEKNMPADKLCEVLKEARAERENGATVQVALMNKIKNSRKSSFPKKAIQSSKNFLTDKRGI